ncbi:signal transduction histidine kinase [Myroides indicus]|uniref:histidine kinase n=2 Tax=Myroides indicus TaxID=1323422 RepID=A0A4R7F162_9FLAO|nr:signal transduction histidine kinase [Myroides indicus]
MKATTYKSVKILPYLFLLFSIPSFVIGQESTIDSLIRELESEKLSVEKRLEIYDELIYQHWEHDAQSGIFFGQEGIVLAKKQNNKKWLSTLYSHIAMSHYYLTQYDSAHYYQDLAFPPAEDLDFLMPLANAHMNKGNIFKMQNLLPQALSSYFNALKTFEKAESEKGKGMVLGNIGHVYLLLRNYEQAEKYLKKSELIAIELNDEEDLGSVSIALTNIYMETDLNKAIDYASKAVNIYQNLGNKYAEAVALSILGACYIEKKDYKQAEIYTERGLMVAKEVGYPNLLAQLYIKLSNVRFYQKRYTESERLAEESRKTDTTSMDIKHNVLFNHIRNNMYLGNLKKAEDYIDQYYESLQQYALEEYQNSLSELEVKYETDKKELKINALEEQHRLYIWLSIAGGAILLIILAFAFVRYRLVVSKRKLAEEEALRLEQEKQLVAVQATLDGESAERTRLAKDLHDGLGGMLSAVKMNLPQVKGDAVLETVDVSRFQTALGMLDDSIQELRRVAHHMMPESLLSYGLKISLADFCAAIPTADFHYFGNEARLSGKMEIMIYRCIHELVNNALKHAEATQINVQLVQESDRISFTVQDNGKGFDWQTVSEGMGLRNIRQRIDAFQGKLDIYSSAEGTEVHVELELRENE